MGGATRQRRERRGGDAPIRPLTSNLNRVEAMRACGARRVSPIRPRRGLSGPDVQKIWTTPTAPRTAPIRPIPTANTAGKKLFSERLYLAYARNHGIERLRDPAATTTSSGRRGTWVGGKEKAPGAAPQGTAMAKNGGADRDLGRRRADPLKFLCYRSHRLEGTLRLGCARRRSGRAPSTSARRRW